jgi:putative endonuclease
VGAWYVYLLQCGNGSIYTGISTDVDRRIGEHLKDKRGAKCLRGKGPFTLLLKKRIGSKSKALKSEYRIKRLKKAEKVALASAYKLN